MAARNSIACPDRSERQTEQNSEVQPPPIFSSRRMSHRQRIAHAAAGWPDETNGPDAYLPTEDEIEAACREFQATWSDDKRDQRRRGVVVGNFGDSNPQRRRKLAHQHAQRGGK